MPLPESQKTSIMLCFMKKKISSFLRLGKCSDIDSLRKRAENNDKDAQCRLGLAYYRGSSVFKDTVQAHYWLEKASKR